MGDAADLGVDEYIREQARFTLVDTLSCMVLGATERQAIAASDAMLFGLKEGSVPPIGGGEKLSITGAALVNGARAAALDFDDYELSGSSHASAPGAQRVAKPGTQGPNDNRPDQRCLDCWI